MPDLDSLLARAQRPPDEPRQDPGVRSLTLVPTNDNAQEVVEQRASQGVPTVAYPRLDADSCLRFDEAMAVQGRGLPFTKVLCPDCPHREDCVYREGLRLAMEARHAVATQTRGVVSPKIMANRRYIFLHENPLSMLKPTYVNRHSFGYLAGIAEAAACHAWSREERAFYELLRETARVLDKAMEKATGAMADVELPAPADDVPGDVYRVLNEIIVHMGAAPPAETVRIALAAVRGELSLVAVVLEEWRDKGGEAKTARKMVAVSKTELPADASVIISDATGSRAELEAALGRPVEDITPPGRLLWHHPVLQILPDRDVTRRRTPQEVLPILRGLLHDLPQYRNVGLITHQPLANTLPDLLEENYRQRLARVDYFGSGLDRGSNVWHQECDALVVLGTPRVPPEAIRLHLLQLGKVNAARLRHAEAEWSWDYWLAVTVTGKRRAVATKHYADRDWHAAYLSLVRSALVQAVGRGRGLLPEGIPVVVVTTENLAPVEDDTDGRHGFPVADVGRFAPLTGAQAKILAELPFEWVGGVGVAEVRSSAEVAKAVGVSDRRVRELLAELERAGRVERCKRLGWTRTS
jgi:hypothetical protein